MTTDVVPADLDVEPPSQPQPVAPPPAPIAISSGLTRPEVRKLSGRALVPYLIAGLAVAALIPILAILRTKKRERSLHIEPAGIRTTIGTLRGEIAWRQIDYIADDGRRVFITGKSTNGFVVPASAFSSTEDREALVTSMQRWVREAR